jgi:hypothetical protein
VGATDVNGRVLWEEHFGQWVFIDRLTGFEERVPPPTPMLWFGGANSMFDFSVNGRIVVFATRANLLPDETEFDDDIYVYDRDQDGDTISSAWEVRFGLNPLDPADAPRTRSSRPDSPRSIPTTWKPMSCSVFLAPAGIWPHTSRRCRPERARPSTSRSASSTSTRPNDFSTVIESDHPVVVDRTMTWDASRAGAHAETSIASPSTTWYLAEGATHGDFDLFYLLENPNDVEAAVIIRYLRLAPQSPVVKTYTVRPHSRLTIWVDAEGPELEACDTAAAIVSTHPIIVERAMYWSRSGQSFAAGHRGAAVSAPALTWFLAEGATGQFFDLYVLVANPGTTPANVNVTYLLPSGETLTKAYSVGPENRLTIGVDGEDPRLADTPVSIVVESSNGQPVVVERTML